jgi:hypothetical protein
VVTRLTISMRTGEVMAIFSLEVPDCSTAQKNSGGMVLKPTCSLLQVSDICHLPTPASADGAVAAAGASNHMLPP